MKLVSRNHLEDWAKRIDSKGDLPYLISRLVRATTPMSTQSDIPSGSTAYIGGWDGIVTCEEDTAYVPKGTSLWEFGTEADNKGKADDDYDKRTANSLGYSKQECVFIFATPRYWKKKDKWIEDKKAQGIWKDVKVYDSSILEQWLDIALSVSRWFSSLIGNYPFDGLMTADEFWEEYSIGPNGLVLAPEVITSGREFEKQQLLNILKGQASIKAIKASTKNEAIAFIIASAKQFDKEESERFFSKSLIIDTEGNFRGIRINTATALNLIPRFEETQPLYSAVSKGHHVLVPLGADDNFNQEIIVLPTIDRDGQINSLIKSGISKDDAEKFSRESGRNITILKKLIGFPHSKAKWLETEEIREIIPALILGRWNETYEGDIELIEILSSQKYSDYLAILNKWKNFEESPILQIGETWRLVSPLDLWTTLSTSLTQINLQQLQECFSLAYKDGNPLIEPENKDDFISFYNKKRRFSNWAREGLTQSLILVGRFGDGLNMPNQSNHQLWVDKIIHELLFDSNGDLWISVDHELPLISEASPLSFLKAVKNSLSKEYPEIMDMFKETDDYFGSSSSHTGLLWALEGLAWVPEYLRDVGLVLLKLARLDPGGNLSNRPINSITEIFKTWHYQTLAPFEERMEVLKYITDKEKDKGWTLLMRMLPESHGTAFPTHKMRWRIFDKNTNLNYTYPEIWDTHTFVLTLLFDLFDYDEFKFSQLLDDSVNLSPKDRNRVLEWAENNYSKVYQKQYETWHTLRKLLSHHRTYPDTDWALEEKELEKYEQLYNKLTPKDAINKNIWLFNDYYPALPEGLKDDATDSEKKYEQRQNRINQLRIEAVKTIIDEIGLKRSVELRNSVKESSTLGEAFSEVIKDEGDVLTVCECLQDSTNTIRFIHGFVFRKAITEGLDWIKQLVIKLLAKGFGPKPISHILIPLNQNSELWTYILTLGDEIQAEYWQNVNPHFYHIPDEDKIYGIEMLIKYNRYYSAIDISAHFLNIISTELLCALLKKAATEDSKEPFKNIGYEIEKTFKELDNRTDLDKSILINLEWLYLPILDSYGNKRSPIILQEELAKNPEFFVEVIKWVYVPKDKKKIEEERKDISDEIIQNRAKQAYHLLHSWKKIPGMKSDNSIDKTELLEWIIKAREIAKKASRLEVADIHIGQVLAQFPENIPEWPLEVIFEVIEEINSESMKRNYSSALFNKRGSSTRGPFEGGNIERGHAKYFENLANDYKNKFPNVSEIFKRLSEGYLIDARRMDEQAERDKLEY
ncbi:hypothetical protein K5G00_21465 [Maribellus maritimus]|nr:hypothetical protein [Maribellus maritimus]